MAAGAFAPGHLGELTRIVPFELADAVLEEVPSARERRVRLLPSRAGLVRRDAELYPDGWQDLILMAILQPEYAAMSAGKDGSLTTHAKPPLSPAHFWVFSP